MGAEFRGKGVHVALGPMMCGISSSLHALNTKVKICRNLMRTPEGGRGWEGASALYSYSC